VPNFEVKLWLEKSSINILAPLVATDETVASQFLTPLKTLRVQVSHLLTEIVNINVEPRLIELRKYDFEKKY
jgi:hypothetical protein